MILLTLLAAILIAALMFAAVYAFSYGIAKVALKVLPESDPQRRSSHVCPQTTGGPRFLACHC